jgi:hypothetical protein
VTVSAVIPNWNRQQDLGRLLEDLRAQSYAVGEAIVVDNGSADDSARVAAAAGARVIALEENRGFAYAVNRGIEAAAGEWVAILNNDVRLPAEWLAKLLDAARAADGWFAGGKLLQASEPGRIDGGFDLLCRGGCAWRAGSGRADGPAWSEPRIVHFLPFTAAIFRRELFGRVGLLDEEFESYLEDVEFGLRCALAGFTGIYAPQVTATHIGSATLGVWNAQTVRRMARNQLLLVAKHYPPDWRRRYLGPILAAQGLWGLVAARHGRLVAWLEGKQEGLRMFRRYTRRGQPELDAVLRASEAELQRLQRQTGYDLYWRLYFAMIRGRA